MSLSKYNEKLVTYHWYSMSFDSLQDKKNYILFKQEELISKLLNKHTVYDILSIGFQNDFIYLTDQSITDNPETIHRQIMKIINNLHSKWMVTQYSIMYAWRRYKSYMLTKY